jgi:cardiolipin synthase
LHKPADLTLPTSLRDADAQLAYAADPAAMLPGHRLRVLKNGEEAFPAMLASIRESRRFVHLETYTLEDDAIGDEFADALIDRARAGVKVRVLYDAVGSLTLGHAFERRLQAAGVELVAFGPLRALGALGPVGTRRALRYLTRRDHRKILVCDGRTGFVGGINIGLDYALRARGGGGWRDTQVRIEGPVVAGLEQQFRGQWIDAGGPRYARYPRAAHESVATPGSAWARIQTADDRGRRAAIRRDYVHAIRRARTRIWLANAYFLPDRGVRRELRTAARRGVDVRVLVTAHSDVRLVQLAGEHGYGWLLRRGVRIYQWPDSHMHAKAAVIDGVWSTIGSYNLDYMSLFHNLELVVELIGREFGQAMEAMFEADFATSRELDADGWERRPLWEQALSAAVYRFRRWL